MCGGEDTAEEFGTDAWTSFYQNVYYKAIKRGDYGALDKLLGHKMAGGSSAPQAQKKEFAVKYRLDHSGASLLHLAILYNQWDAIAKPLVEEYGSELVAGK